MAKWFDWLIPAGLTAAGVATGNPALIAGGASGLANTASGGGGDSLTGFVQGGGNLTGGTGGAGGLGGLSSLSGLLGSGSPLGKIGFGGGGDVRQTSRSGRRVLPNPEFVQWMSEIGLPVLNLNDLMTMSPRSPGGLSGRTGGFTAQLQPAGAPAAPAEGESAPTGPRLYTRSDVQTAFDQLGPTESQEKAADLERFLWRPGKLDPEGFTLEELDAEIAKARKRGASGRSAGNLERVRGYLEQQGELEQEAQTPKFTRLF